MRPYRIRLMTCFKKNSLALWDLDRSKSEGFFYSIGLFNSKKLKILPPYFFMYLKFSRTDKSVRLECSIIKVPFLFNNCL